MINLFGTNKVVPNGYIYTSHKGSEYIYFEGIWFDHKNMKMIDPNKAPKMNEAAIKQIVEHNCNNKQMIGESFTFTGKTYTYVGKKRFTEDGVLSESSILSEVIAEGERVYNVPRETLDKQWNNLGFFILPPFVEDVRIPAGFELKGFRFSPKKSRFMNVRDGSLADNMMNRKLWAEASSIAKSMRHKDDILPVNSTIMVRDNNARAEWNGTDFSGTDGEVIIPAQKANDIKMKYNNFIKQNPALFPDLTGSKQAEPEQPKHQSGVVRSEQPSQVTEAVGKIRTGNADSTEIPDGFQLDRFEWDDGKGKWYTDRNQVIDDPEMIDSLNKSAVKRIQQLNKMDKFPVGSIAEYKGNYYTWTGERFYNKDVGTIPEQDTISLIDDYTNNPDEVRDEPQDEPKTDSSAETSPESSTEQSSESSPTSVPDGYVITSKAGIPYYKKGGKWISSQTKKPMNSSAAQSIERAAIAKIAKFNETADVKIGDKWKSNKGIEYTYVGDDRFISSNGKMAPKSSAQGILDKMRAAKEPEQAEVQQDTVQDTVQDEQPGKSDEVKAQNTTQDTTEPVQGGEGSELESLANQIKAHPKARKITVLLTRGDKVSLLAADLMLAGKEQDAIKILKALNSSDE